MGRIKLPALGITTLDGADEYMTNLELIQESFLKREFKRHVPKTEYPELRITVPDSFETIELAPLYDVHMGSKEHDGKLFQRHLEWIAETPNVLSWLGGDIFENKTANEAYMGHDPLSPEEQLLLATETLAPIQHKLFCSFPGNHEARTAKQAGMDSAKRLAENLRLPYFTDYVIITIKWRGNKFRILAMHGAGGGSTPGAQRNSARKELTWIHPDIIWSGHLHQPLTDPVKMFCFDQKTDEVYEKDSLVIISPSYVKYFGGYAAAKRLSPGLRGLGVVTLNEDGRLDSSVHARGSRK